MINSSWQAYMPVEMYTQYVEPWLAATSAETLPDHPQGPGADNVVDPKQRPPALDPAAPPEHSRTAAARPATSLPMP